MLVDCDAFCMSQFLECVFINFLNHKVTLWYCVKVNHNRFIYLPTACEQRGSLLKQVRYDISSWSGKK